MRAVARAFKGLHFLRWVQIFIFDNPYMWAMSRVWVKVSTKVLTLLPVAVSPCLQGLFSLAWGALRPLSSNYGMKPAGESNGFQLSAISQLFKGEWNVYFYPGLPYSLKMDKKSVWVLCLFAFFTSISLKALELWNSGVDWAIYIAILALLLLLATGIWWKTNKPSE